MSAWLRVHKQFAILFNALGDNGVVHNRHHFYDVLPEQVVEQGAIGVENFHQELAFFQQRGLLVVVRIGLLRLLVYGLHGVGQQTC